MTWAMNMNKRKQAHDYPSELRAFALSFPSAHEDFPWGERVAKVGKKVFVFLGHDDDAREHASPAKKEHIGEPGSFGMSVKLPQSGKRALQRSFASPTGYGLGAKGWVSMRFQAGEEAPMEELKAWIEESYRAIAPKKQIRELDAARAKRA
jgi:predicted DNA-binding protein (MmcQ/YjbR family)